jgi:hypothetical protein
MTKLPIFTIFSELSELFYVPTSFNFVYHQHKIQEYVKIISYVGLPKLFFITQFLPFFHKKTVFKQIPLFFSIKVFFPTSYDFL